MKVKKILVVDAAIEVAIRLSQGLQQVLGKRVWVETCHSAETALYALYLKDFDMLITEQNLPGISGKSLIEEARKINPNLKAVLIAEASEDVSDAKGAKNATIFVEKPFQLARFVPLIQVLLK